MPKIAASANHASNVPNPYVTVPGPGTYSYTINVIDQFCQLTDSFSMSIEVPPASLDLDLPSPVYLCPVASVLLNAGAGYDGYQWSTGASGWRACTGSLMRSSLVLSSSL